jgi:hypothetical protein
METTLTPEEQQFIIENRLLMCSRDLAAKLNCSKTKVLRFLKDKDLQPPAEVVLRFRSKAAAGKTILTPTQDEIIKRDFLTVPIKKLAKKLGVSYTAVRTRIENLGLVIPKELAEQRKKANQIKPGNVPTNKGKKMPAHIYKRCKGTMFKKGHLPHNSVGVKDGDLSFRVDNKGFVYVYIRLSLGKWYPLHQYCWEVANGKVPKGHCLWFIDGDSMNCTLSNLKMISKGESIVKNSCSVRLTDSYVAQTLSRVKGGVGLFDPELKQIVLQNKPLIELKRKQLLLNRTINERKESKQSA